MLSNAISIVLSVFLMLGIGFLLTHIGWFNKEVTDVIAKLVTHIAMPCMTVYQLLSQYDRASLLNSLPALGMAYLSVGLCYLASVGTSKLFRIPAGRAGTFRAVFTFGNTIFIGLPINEALFGAASIPPVLMYYVANTSLFWILGAYGIRCDHLGHGGRLFSLDALKKLATPPLISFLLTALLLMLGIKLPEFLMRTARYVGNVVTPLSLFFIGSLLYGMVRQGLKWEKGYGIILGARFLLSPLLMLGIMALFGGLSPVWQSSFLMQAAMPSQSSCAIIAHQYKADAPYATGAITLSTLISMATIPLYAMVTTLL